MLDHPLPLKLHQSNQPTVKALYSLKLILRHKKSGRGSADLYAAVMQDCRLFGGCIEQTHSVLILVSSNWTKLFLLL